MKKDSTYVYNWIILLYTRTEEVMAPQLQYSCLENPMDGGAWWAAVHGVTKDQTWLSDFTFTFHFHALEKEMATRFSVLAWRIPGTVEPDGLLSMGSHRVGHDWSNLAAAAEPRCELRMSTFRVWRAQGRLWKEQILGEISEVSQNLRSLMSEVLCSVLGFY